MGRTSRPWPTRLVPALVLLLVLSGCTRDTGDDDAPVDDDPATQGPEDDADQGPDDDDDGDEPTDTDPHEDDAPDEPLDPPVSTITLEPVDAPQSAVEVRVAEIIIEFDGEVTDDGTLLTLEEPILFDFDSADLKSSAREALDDIAEVLAFYPDAPVEVLGHTDDQGSADYNLDLSQRRADTVATALTQRGIASDRISSEGRGLTEPIASNDTDEGRAQNRRVEILIVGVDPPDAG